MRPLLKLLTMALMLSGCAGADIPVKERWADGVRNYALVPIYPMREDVFIGDLRIHSLEGDAYSLDSRSLGALPGASAALFAQEKERPEYPSSGTPPKPGETGIPDTAWPQPTGLLTSTASGNRLRLAALPDINISRVSSFGAGVGGLSGLWNFVVGGGVEASETLLISLSGVETLEISDLVIAPRFKQFVDAQLGSPDAYKTAVCAATRRFKDPTFQSTAISVITRVIYARGIKYTYGDTLGAALRASAGIGVLPTDDFAAMPQGEQTRGVPDIDLGKLPAGESPGVTAQFSHESRNGLSLAKTFEKPLAFGVDVITLGPEALRKTIDGGCDGVVLGHPDRGTVLNRKGTAE